MKDKKKTIEMVEIIEIWKYSKKTKVATDLICILANGKVIRMADGFMGEIKKITKAKFINYG